jgi:hypothetical protein
MQMGWARFVRAQPIAEFSITPPLAVGDAWTNNFSFVRVRNRLSGYAVAGPANDRDTIRPSALPEIDGKTLGFGPVADQGPVR